MLLCLLLALAPPLPAREQQVYSSRRGGLADGCAGPGCRRRLPSGRVALESSRVRPALVLRLTRAAPASTPPPGRRSPSISKRSASARASTWAWPES